MMEYRSTPERAEFAKNQLAKNSGWVLAYHADEKSGEYSGASYEYILKNVGLPAHSYVDAPTLPEPGYAIVRSEEGKRWEHLPDHRGEMVFDKGTRQQQTITDIGELSDSVTVIPFETEFDIWDGEKWVTDEVAKIQAQRQTAQRTWQSKLVEAHEYIQILTDALALGIATEEEQTRLQQWKSYRVILNRVDFSMEDPEWPTQPSEYPNISK